MSKDIEVAIMLLIGSVIGFIISVTLEDTYWDFLGRLIEGVSYLAFSMGIVGLLSTLFNRLE